jgi:hypothetical protein
VEKYINEFNKECYRGVDNESSFYNELFHKPKYQGIDEDEHFALHTNIGSLTVIDRMTGFGWRDIESGYRDVDGNFWLASGNYDVRSCGLNTIIDAINWVKQNANTCNPDEYSNDQESKQ